MPRKMKNSAGAGSMKENKPKRRRVTISESLKNVEMPTGVSLGYMQDTIDGFVANYLALGPIDIFSNTELAFLAILSTTCMCATVSEIYAIIKKLFPKENLPKDYEKRIRNVLVEVGCFAVYKPDSQPKPGTKTWKIKSLYCVIPHELVAKVSTGFYRKSAEQKQNFRNSHHKWANYGPEVKDLWKNASRFVAMQTQTRIDVIKNSDNPLECLNSPSISTSSQIDVTAKTKSFQPTVSMPVKNRAIERSRRRLKPLNSPSISTPGQTGVTAGTESFKQPVTMPVKNRAIERSRRRLKPLNSPSISTPGQTGVTAGTESFKQPLSMQVHTCIGEKSRSSMEPMDSPSISIPCQTDVTAETELFDLFWRKIDFLRSLQYRGGPTMDLLTSDVTAETESFDLFGSEMDHSTSPQYIAGDHAMDCSPSEYPTSDNGACGTTWDSNMPAWQTYPARPYIRDVTLGSHLSELEEPPYPFKPVPGTSSYPLKPVPETPSEGPKTFTSDDLQAVIKDNEDTYFIFGHKFKRDTLDDVSNKDVEE